jgi:hypothetical protein
MGEEIGQIERMSTNYFMKHSTDTAVKTYTHQKSQEKLAPAMHLIERINKEIFEKLN